ncbi:LADA_0C05072g1_1 [Lachancea dasiensis]|uniref:LADA_0C05072g1_1 n=1 Tax=Lachancea dasiensis TaxID=1072105 RepID=A0A1G4IYT5_9SACH|nr:LADA_0C05072g1_1 [Lachancea dasiensis]
MKVIKRRRSIKSCRYCYEHKLRCNKGHPCNNCEKHETLDLCEYGFDRANLISDIPRQPPLKRLKSLGQNVASKPQVHRKPDPYYPYLIEAQEASLLAERSRSDGFSSNDDEFNRNAITEFNRQGEMWVSTDEIQGMIPESKASMNLLVDTYFYRINPIIPLLDRDAVLQQIRSIYDTLQNGQKVDTVDLIIMFTILFTVAYSHVAEGQIPDLLLCNNYYAAFQTLLRDSIFPYKASISCIQGLVIVNFVLDPNMVGTLALSAILLRQAQQLGIDRELNNRSKGSMRIYHQVLWHYLLYFEGSSSVVAGLEFMHSEQAFVAIDLPLVDDSPAPSHLAFANGRFLINQVFRKIMHYKDAEIIPIENSLEEVTEQFQRLNEQVEDLCVKIEQLSKDQARYFVSTLRIFLLRAYLRFKALFPSTVKQSEKNPLKERLDCRPPAIVDNLITNGSPMSKDIVELSILLLFYTVRRLTVGGCSRYAWYTRGSTVMQYLFILLKDIHRNPTRDYYLSTSDAFPVCISEDILECIKTEKSAFRFVLIEELMTLIEVKLLPMWDGHDVNRFLLVRSIKKRIWEKNQRHIDTLAPTFSSLKSCRLFTACHSKLKRLRGSSFEESIKEWNFESADLDSEKIMSWLSDI